LKTAKHLATLDDLTTVTNADGKKEKQKTAYKMSQVDETAWCACFVPWCLAEAKKTPLKGARAEYYKDYGTESVLIGNIRVIQREPFNDSSSGWHVGFYIAGDPREGYVALLGGNQNSSACRKWFAGIEPEKILAALADLRRVNVDRAYHPVCRVPRGDGVRLQSEQSGNAACAASSARISAFLR
jgi:uncharacterized protein (TIGR02594 family)